MNNKARLLDRNDCCQHFAFTAETTGLRNMCVTYAVVLLRK